MRGWLIFPVLLILLSACHAARPTATAAVPTAAGDTWATPSDQPLAQAIRAALLTDAHLTAAAPNIAITVDHGAVTLRGAVDDTLTKARAGSQARRLAGVQRVDNALSVRPSPTLATAAP